jgi:hypothetical protein
LYYDIITEFPFSIYYSTSMRLYDKNWPNTPVVEYIKY